MRKGRISPKKSTLKDLEGFIDPADTSLNTPVISDYATLPASYQRRNLKPSYQGYSFNANQQEGNLNLGIRGMGMKGSVPIDIPKGRLAVDPELTGVNVKGTLNNEQLFSKNSLEPSLGVTYSPNERLQFGVKGKSLASDRRGVEAGMRYKFKNGGVTDPSVKKTLNSPNFRNTDFFTDEEKKDMPKSGQRVPPNLGPIDFNSKSNQSFTKEDWDRMHKNGRSRVERFLGTETYNKLKDRPEGSVENVGELIDPLGSLSWNDALQSYDQWHKSGRAYPTFDEGVEMFGALPMIGKAKRGVTLAKGAKGAIIKAGQKIRTVAGNVQETLNTGDATKDVYEEDLPAIKSIQPTRPGTFSGVPLYQNGGKTDPLTKRSIRRNTERPETRAESEFYRLYSSAKGRGQYTTDQETSSGWLSTRNKPGVGYQESLNLRSDPDKKPEKKGWETKWVEDYVSTKGKQGYDVKAQKGTGRLYPDVSANYPEVEYEGDKHWNAKRFGYSPFFGTGMGAQYGYNTGVPNESGSYPDITGQNMLHVGDSDRENRNNLREDIYKYHLADENLSRKEAWKKTNKFIRQEINPVVNSDFHKLKKKGYDLPPIDAVHDESYKNSLIDQGMTSNRADRSVRRFDRQIRNHQKGGLPKFQNAGYAENQDGSPALQPSTAYYAGKDWGHMLPEVTKEEKLPITTKALQGWSKENDPIAYAAREGMNNAASDWVGPGLAAITAPITLPLLGSGLAAAGEFAYGAAAPSVRAAWGTQVPGMAGVPGATFGNAINAGFAAHGATHIIPDTKKFIANPTLQGGLDVGFDALEMIPAIGPTISGLNAGTKAAVNAASKVPGVAKNYAKSQLLSRHLNKTPLNVPSTMPKRSLKIDPIKHSTVGIKNDFIDNMSASEYNQYLEDLYLSNAQAYDNPLVEWKGLTKPSSIFKEVGNNTDKLSELQRNDSGMFFKDQFCPPGSECAKASNAVTSKMYTDLTGKPFNVNENAHNAWHMEDQMTRYGGKLVESEQQMKLGDRILMGNGVNQSTEVAGYAADPAVRHAGTYAGIHKVQGSYQPMLFESGKNNPLHLNPLDFTFTGRNSVKKIVRPQQFIGNEPGLGVVEKNLRYAFQDAPASATYSSENKTVQKLINDSEFWKGWLKRSHDLTNDEYNEIVNSVISVGAQETKLKGNLPGSKLSKAKVKVQDELNNLGLTKPVKTILNAGKSILNTKLPSNLPEYPGMSMIEMEAAQLAAKEGSSFENALSTVKSNYQPKPRFTKSNTDPSNGPWRQKYQTDVDIHAGIGDDLKGHDAFPNAIGLMAENFKKAQKLYPEADQRQLIDLATLMWNSPGKASNKKLVDFYMFGKDNPNPEKFNFDYVRKVNQFKDDLINVHPTGKREPHLELFKNKNYPEIQYQNGGLHRYQQ